MLKTTVIRHFGSEEKAALALGISRQAVNQWGKVVPKGAAFQLQVLTGGKLRVEPRLYEAAS